MRSRIISSWFLVFLLSFAALKGHPEGIVLSLDDRGVGIGGVPPQAPSGPGARFDGYLDHPPAGSVGGAQVATQTSKISYDGLSIEGGGTTLAIAGMGGSAPQAASSMTMGFTVQRLSRYSFTGRCKGGETKNDATAGLIVSSTSGDYKIINIQGAGEDSEQGFIQPGDYCIIFGASRARVAVPATSWSVKLTLEEKPPRYRPEDAKAYAKASKITSEYSFVTGVAAIVAAFTPGLQPMAPILGYMSLAGEGTSLALGDLAHDPPDTNYSAIAQPLFSVPPLLPTGPNISPAAVDALRAWADCLGRSHALSQVLYTSINRANAALVASNLNWNTLQLNAVKSYEAQLADCMYREPMLRSNAVFQLMAGGFPGIVISQDDYLSFMQSLASSTNLPPILQTAADAVGMDSTTVRRVRDLFLGIDMFSGTGNFPAKLADGAFDLALSGAASSLWFYSPALVNPTVLPGNQLRFDVPARPGSTYTIEFADDLTGNQNWNSLLVTNTTTVGLLPITNSIPNGTSTRFFRIHRN